MNYPVLLTVGAVCGGALALSVVPVALGAVGFTKLGIAGGSVAAKMMSAAAVANGGGVAAGSLVAVLQSVGAGGLSTGASTALGSIGSVLGGYLAHKSS
ncbi:interferon alpha-inducible protein 27-like protein 2A [Sminthopsis crassicaudata]|uniref:interferon alpha-inducible protein 27-like protein 2A n=1 Tax=Sminthopsis crassicaudata TaxID=9301 RepID=UPI003D69F3DF